MYVTGSGGTVKYDNKGNQLWSAEGDNVGIALDSAANVYATGDYEGDYLTAKFDCNGNRLWEARYHDQLGHKSWPAGIATDATGNVYITGSTVLSDRIFNPTLRYTKPKFEADERIFVTIKYDTNGNEQWVATYHGPAKGDDVAAGIAIDRAGNIYVVGQSEGNGTDDDYTTIKYDSDGNQLWVARHDSPSHGKDQPMDVAIDGWGNIYVTGLCGRDYGTIKYDSDGNQLWVRCYNSPENGVDISTSIALDADGGIYVTGSSNGNCTTIKYDSEGNQQWRAQYDGPLSKTDYAADIAVDLKGNVYITGSSIVEICHVPDDYGDREYDDYVIINYVQ